MSKPSFRLRHLYRHDTRQAVQRADRSRDDASAIGAIIATCQNWRVGSGRGGTRTTTMQTTSTSAGTVLEKRPAAAPRGIVGVSRRCRAIPRSARAFSFDLEPLGKSVPLNRDATMNSSRNSEMLRGITFGLAGGALEFEDLRRNGAVLPRIWAADPAAAVLSNS